MQTNRIVNEQWNIFTCVMQNNDFSSIPIHTEYYCETRPRPTDVVCGMVLSLLTLLVISGHPWAIPFFKRMLHHNDGGGLLIRYAMELWVASASRQLRGWWLMRVMTDKTWMGGFRNDYNKLPMWEPRLYSTPHQLAFAILDVILADGKLLPFICKFSSFPLYLRFCWSSNRIGCTPLP